MSETYLLSTLIVSAVSCAIIAVLGTAGNLMAVVSLVRCARLRKSSTYYIVNLAVSNLPMCILGMPISVVWFVQIILYNELQSSEVMVRCVVILGFICNQAELQTICVLGLNRVLAMTHPRIYRKLVQMRVHIWVLSGLWIYSVLLWMPLFTGIAGQLDIRSKSLFVMIDVPGSTARKVYMIVGFLLPISFSLVCHVVLLFKGLGLGGTSDAASRQQWRHHVTKTVFLVFLLLLLLSVPHAVVHVLHPYHMDIPNTWLLIHVLFFSRYILDPAVFVWISSEYRRAFSETLSLMFPRVWTPSTVPPLDRRGTAAPPCTPAFTPRHKVIDLSSLDLSKLAEDTKRGLKFSKKRKVSCESKDSNVYNVLMQEN